jgi:antiviral helicase SKI2
VILKAAPTREQVKHYFVLSRVDSETKEGKNGTIRCHCLEDTTAHDSSIDVDSQAVPPRWPPSAQSLVVEDGVYERTIVPVTSITFVTNRTLKVTFTLDLDRLLTNLNRSTSV